MLRVTNDTPRLDRIAIEQMRFSLRIVLLMVAAAAVVTLVGAFSYRQFVGQTGAGTSPDFANRSFSSRLEIPDSATDINFYVDLCWIEADFSISEEAFLKWCRQQGWPVATVDSRTRVVFRFARSSPNADKEFPAVSNGYIVDTATGQVIYDVERRRGCITHYDG